MASTARKAIKASAVRHGGWSHDGIEAGFYSKRAMNAFIREQLAAGRTCPMWIDMSTDYRTQFFVEVK